jgi:hypothetical protein
MGSDGWMLEFVGPAVGDPAELSTVRLSRQAGAQTELLHTVRQRHAPGTTWEMAFLVCGDGQVTFLSPPPTPLPSC